LTSLDISTNNIRAAGGKALAEALHGNRVINVLNISANRLGSGPKPNSTDMSAVVALADAIPGMGAMTSLNLASNKLGVEGAKIIAACLPKCT
jgi:hypothetical protein